MALEQHYDVVVAGAGPGGAIAAKRCAEQGLSTLLLEKKPLPRDKVCTGMIMGPWAHGIIARHFGEIPASVYTEPQFLAGHRIHVAGADPETLPWRTPLAWRKDLDAWMVDMARAAGVTVRDGAKVTRLSPQTHPIPLTFDTAGTSREVAARFVVGADGATSPVRRSLFPRLKVRYSAPLRLFFRGALALDAAYIHWFFPHGRPRPRFNVNHKDDVFLIEGSGIRELRPEIAQTLEPHGYDPQSQPAHRDACAVALVHEQLLDGTFIPASHNTLLIGDAAGLVLPLTFEGIGSALKSGLIAAEAIRRSAETGEPPDGAYREGIAPIIDAIREIHATQTTLSRIPHDHPRDMAQALVHAYERTMTIQTDAPTLHGLPYESPR